MATPARFCCLCGRPAAEVGKISARGRCAGCGDLAMMANTHQIRAHRGPYFQHWRRRTVEAFGGIIPPRHDQNEEAA